MDPVLHLSIVVADLDEARSFYVDVLGCPPGRDGGDWIDVWFHGLQLTLQRQPEHVLAAGSQGKRHFGVTLGRSEFDATVDRLARHHVQWLEPVSTDHPGTAGDQTKGKVADPSGNVVEFKTYADPESALGPGGSPGHGRPRR